MRNIASKLEELKKEFQVVDIQHTQKTKRSFLSIEDYQVTLNNGAVFNRQKLVKGDKSGDAVIIVPVTKENEVFVIIQPRVFTKTGLGVEVPAGYVDSGESATKAAIRELKEEIGCVPSDLIHLKSYYQDQGISGAFNTCFLALDCEEKFPQNLDRDEYIKYLKCSLDDLYYLVDEGIINDANSIIAINETKKLMLVKNML